MNQKTYKLEIAISGGGVWGVAAAGFFTALQENQINPEIITGISSGFHAAFICLTQKRPEDKILWFQQIRDQFNNTRSDLFRFIPPYDTRAETIWEWSKDRLVDPQNFKKLGVEKFLVGFTNVKKGFKFETVDIVELEAFDAWRMIIRSGMIPFLTIPAPWFEGCLDGGIRKPLFLSQEQTDVKIGLAYLHSPRIHKKQFDHLVYLPQCSFSFVNATNDQLARGFEQGYQIGLKFKL